jgi:hypothetical protein
MDALDKAEETSAYVVIKISIDEFSGNTPSKEEMRAAAQQFAMENSFQLMTPNAIVSFEATVLKDFVWLDEESEQSHEA